MGLVVQTRLKNYLSGVSLDFKPGGGLGFSFVGVDELLREKATTNALAALDDLYDLKSAGGGSLQIGHGPTHCLKSPNLPLTLTRLINMPLCCLGKACSWGQPA